MTSNQLEKANRFRALHQEPGFFVIANAWDAGSARILAGLGFQALATSSGASAGVLGRRDGMVSRQEALDHAQAIFAATDNRSKSAGVRRDVVVKPDRPPGGSRRFVTDLAPYPGRSSLSYAGRNGDQISARGTQYSNAVRL